MNTLIGSRKRAPVAALAALSGLLCGCPKTFEAVQDARYHTTDEACKLGDALVGDNEGKPVRCGMYAPTTASHDVCRTWPNPRGEHIKAIKALASGDGPLYKRFSGLTSISSEVEVENIITGRVSLVSASVGVTATVNPAITVGAEVQHVDLLVDVHAGGVGLGQNALQCMNAQTADDIKAGIGLKAGEKVIGFISRADIGYVHKLTLTSASLSLVPGASNVFKATASAFSLHVLVAGGMDPTYLSDFEKLLAKLEGTQAAVHATALASSHERVRLPATTFVSVATFPNQPK